MITEEQFAELGNKIDRLSSGSMRVPKRNGPDWTKILWAVLSVGAVIGSVAIGYIVETKADAATEHKEITKDAAKTFETKEHATEVHKRHDKRAEKSIEKIEALYQHVIERKPRRSVRVQEDDDDGN